MKNPVLEGNDRLTLPVSFTISTWLLLKYIGIGEVWWGVYYSLLALMWIVSIIVLIVNVSRKRVTINEEGKIVFK
jgi:hypothetical protein